MKILFKNAEILVRNDNDYELIHNGFLSVCNDIIEYIGKDCPKGKFDVIKNVKGKLLMPGLINAHGHSPMTLLRGVGAGLPLQNWLNDVIFSIEAKMVPEDIENGCRVAVMEMLASGTTQFSEMYDFPYSSMKVVAETGIKANICRTGLCFDKDIKMEDWPRLQEVEDIYSILNGDKEGNEEALKELGSFTLPDYIKEAVKEERIKGDVSLHSEYLTTPTFVKELSDFCKGKNTKRQVHVSETLKEHEECIKKYGKTPTEYFKSLGYLDGGNAYFAHCVYVTENDLQIIKETGTTIVNNPSSNMKLGSGFAPIAKALKMGINVALGTDGCASNNNLNMFEEMHLAALLQTGINCDPVCISSKNVLDMATINGAKALGRTNTGKLKVGYKADIIALDLSKPHLHPINNILDLIVYSAQASDVCMTMVDGKILYENGKYYTIDEKKVYADFYKSVERLMK